MRYPYLKVFDNIFFDLEENDEIKNIIDQVSCVFDLIITRFGEVINEIMPRISKMDDFVDITIILFIRKIIEQIDTINVLYCTGLFSSAQIILRSLIENIIGIEFILKEQTEERAAAYYLDHHFQELEMAKKYYNKESEQGKLLIKHKGENEFDKFNKDIEKKSKALECLINSNKVFQKINVNRRKKSSEKNKKYIQWYEVCSNVKSFYGLMKETGYGEYYDGIYSGLSFEIHGFNATMGIGINNNKLGLKRIRNFEEGEATFKLICSFSIGLLIKVYQYLGDGEDEKSEFKEFFKDFVIKRDIAAKNLDMIINISNNDIE